MKPSTNWVAHYTVVIFSRRCISLLPSSRRMRENIAPNLERWDSSGVGINTRNITILNLEMAGRSPRLFYLTCTTTALNQASLSKSWTSSRSSYFSHYFSLDSLVSIILFRNLKLPGKNSLRNFDVVSFSWKLCSVCQRPRGNITLVRFQESFVAFAQTYFIYTCINN